MEIHIRQNGPGQLFFDILSDDAQSQFTSIQFETLCALEAAVHQLQRLPKEKIEQHRGRVVVSLHTSRRKICESKSILQSEANRLIAEIRASLPTAIVIDTRPSRRQKDVCHL
jgi:hypothetical protein